MEGVSATAKVPDLHACLDRWLVPRGEHEKGRSPEFHRTTPDGQMNRISNVSGFNDGWLVQLNGINEGTFFWAMSMCRVSTAHCEGPKVSFMSPVPHRGVCSSLRLGFHSSAEESRRDDKKNGSTARAKRREPR